MTNSEVAISAPANAIVWPRLPESRTWWVRSRAWTSILLLCPFAIAALFSYPTVVESSTADFLLDSAGWLLFAAGAFFRWWATLYVGGRKCVELTVEGPYSLCRNPLYFGTALMLLATVFISHSTVFASGVLLASAYYLVLTIPVEEYNLRAKFGAAFEEYCRSTPRFWPRMRLYRASPTVTSNVAGLQAEFRRTLVWIWLPVAAELLVHLHARCPWLHRLPLP